MSIEIVHQPSSTLTGKAFAKGKGIKCNFVESRARPYILITFNAIIDVFQLKLNSVSVFITLIVFTVYTRYFRIKNISFKSRTKNSGFAKYL